MSRHVVLSLFVSVGLAACATTSPTPSGPAPGSSASAPPAPGIAPEDLVGRWGFASYHKEADRVRTSAQARGQCGNPYVINRGPTGGALMHLPDVPAPQELRTKAGPDGKRYVGPDGPAADSLDREILSFDGKTLVLKWVDPEVASRYGTAVYVRCAPKVAAPRRGSTRPAAPPPPQ